MAPAVPTCTAAAVVLHDGKLLMAKRAREPGRGLWTLPGGRVESGETLREAVIREVREETAIEIEPDGLIGIVERIVRADDGSVEFHYIICDFVATPRSFKEQAGDDASEVRWVPVGELSTMALTDGLLQFLSDRGVLDGRTPRVS
ncbi:MAG: NUDIX domain-containing protein [Actinomycetota bacterium]